MAERVYTIPLRKAFKRARTQRADAAISVIRAFILRHMKSDEVRIGKYLNEYIWQRGRKKIPRRVKVKTEIETRENKKIATVELMGHEYKSLKVQAPKVTEETKKKIEERLGQKAIEKQKEDKMIEEGKKVEKPESESTTESKPKPEEQSAESEKSDVEEQKIEKPESESTTESKSEPEEQKADSEKPENAPSSEEQKSEEKSESDSKSNE